MRPDPGPFDALQGDDGEADRQPGEGRPDSTGLPPAQRVATSPMLCAMPWSTGAAGESHA